MFGIMRNGLMRSPFVVGMVIGSMAFGVFTRRAEGRSAAAAEPPAVCTNPPPGLTQEESAFLQVQCAVHQQIFGDASEPSSAYRFEEAFSKLGVYDGQNHTGRAVRFEAGWVLPLDLRTHAPHLWGLGFEANAVAGTLSGPAGKTAVVGTQVFTNGLTPDPGYVFIVAATPASGELNAFLTCSRILAGVRVVDTSTGQSTLVADLAGTPSLWAVEGDLATLYCGCTPEGSGNPVDPACVRRAYDTYKNCVKTAEAQAARCLANALAVFGVCMGGCGFLLVLGIAGAGVCSLVCLATYAIMMADCIAELMIALESCKAQLKIDLRACGVVIHEH